MGTGPTPTMRAARAAATLGLAAWAAAALTGCAGDPVSAAVVPPGASAFRQSAVSGPYADEAWWRTLGDARLAALVERAASANHDVRIAVERVRQARAGQAATESRLWPTVSATASASNASSGLPDAVKRAGQA